MMRPSSGGGDGMRNDEIRDVDHHCRQNDVDRDDRDGSASASASASAIVVTTTHLTNPGIIDRLERDVNDHLRHFGFRLIRTDRCRAAFLAPRPPSYLPPHLHHPAASTRDFDEYDENCDVATVLGRRRPSSSTTTSTGRTRAPLLRLRVLDSDVIPTVGPFLRTYVRLSHISSSPMRLRAIVDCDFVVVASSSASSGDGGGGVSRGQAASKNGRRDSGHVGDDGREGEPGDAAASRKVAHQVHMLVRNSMGSALCMDLAIILPRYRHQNNAKTITTTTTTSMEGKEKPRDDDSGRTEEDTMILPLASRSVMHAMTNNPDACYPSVRLLERGIDDDYGNEDGVTGGLREGVDDDSMTMDVIVRTRMCTIRHTPALFRWLHSLSWPLDDADFVDDGDVEGDGSRAPSTDEITTSSDKAQSTRNAVVPIVVACIEKVANLHRVLMLCHDRCSDRCDGNVGRDEVNDDDVGSSAGRNIRNYEKCADDDEGLRTPECSFTLSNVVVVLPNIEGGRRRNGVRRQKFEDAVNNFLTIVSADRGMAMSHRPTFVHEEHAVAVISGMIEQRRRASSSFPSSLPHPESRTTPPHFSPRLSPVVGIDLHPAALTLDGSYLVTASPISTTLRAIREAGAIVFGYESSGIPKVIADTLDSWVQIPSRSSINVVAAMSIFLDALFG